VREKTIRDQGSGIRGICVVIGVSSVLEDSLRSLIPDP